MGIGMDGFGLQNAEVGRRGTERMWISSLG
jgi:hypothetical protein